MPTPAGVPVRITSPGSRVMSFVTKAMSSVTGKIISLSCTTRLTSARDSGPSSDTARTTKPLAFFAL
jgi:hypothetical protein